METEDIKLLETQMKMQSPDLHLQEVFNTSLNGVQMLFKNNSEKYEYLIKNDPNNPWIAKFKNTKEYKLLYE